MSQPPNANENDKQKVVIKPAIDELTFEKLQNDFNEVINGIKDNAGLVKFKDEYEKLMTAFLKSYESEKRLMRKCRELKSEMLSNAIKVTQAEKLSSDDPNNMAVLKKETEQAWKMVDAAVDREAKALETINGLKAEIANLNRLIEESETSLTAPDHLIELTKAKEKLLKERDEQQIENQKLKEQIEETKNQIAHFQDNLLNAENKIAELNQDIGVKNAETERERCRKELLESELQQIRTEVEKKIEEIRLTSNSVETLKQTLKQKEEENRLIKVSLEHSNRQIQITEAKQKEYQIKLEQQIKSTEQLKSENSKKRFEVKQREEEANRFKAEYQKIAKQTEAAHRKLHQTDDERLNLERTRDKLKNEIHAYENEMESMRKALETDRRACEDLAKEKDALNKTLAKSVTQTAKQATLLKTHELSKQNLEQEIANYRDEAQKQRSIIYKLERERDRFITEASELTQKVLQNMDELKCREMQIFENKKKIAEAETKLKQQQNLYEAVRSDRNLYSKHLIEAQEEIGEMKRKLKVLTHQTVQMKDDIAGKEAALIRENLERQKIEKEREQLRADLNRMKIQLANTNAHIEAQEAEESKLLKILAETENERVSEKKEYDQVIGERDLLGTQLVRRNDELALLYEKIRIQQSILSKGEGQYNQRLRDLNLLKQEVRKLRREKALLQATATKVEDLKNEVHRVQQNLMKERTRAKALEEELQNPVNVHRWRKLEGSDPSTFEMIQKIQVLQKRLIRKTEEVIEKELLIQEKEKIYVELKHVLARQPGPEVAEQLNVYHNLVRNKNKQMKALTAEINMYESQSAEYKVEIETLNNELQNMKQKYFKQKKQEHMRRMVGGEATEPTEAKKPIQPQRPKNANSSFTGGGFKLTQAVS